MTIIITLGNSRQVIQISDRRLSANSKVITDSSNKALLFTCLDARMAVGFTGLAKIGSFGMQHWLVDAFAEAAKPDHLFFKTMERLTEMLTELFRNHPLIKIQKPIFKRLSIMASGYHQGADGLKAVSVLVSNFEVIGDEPAATAADTFRLSFARQSSEVDACMIVSAVGNTDAFLDQDWTALSNLVRSNALQSDVIEVAKTVVRRAAARKQAKGTIGKHLAAIVVPANLSEDSYAMALNDQVSDTLVMIDLVVSTPDFGYSFRDPRIATSTQAPPDIGRRDPCHCGSGARFKNCHGRQRRN